MGYSLIIEIQKLLKWSDRRGLCGKTIKCSISMPYDRTRSRVWLKQWVGLFTLWQKPIESINEVNALLRLSFVTSTWTLKSPTIITLSDLRTKLDRNSENSDIKSEYSPGAPYTITNRTGCGVFQFGWERLRTILSNVLWFRGRRLPTQDRFNSLYLFSFRSIIYVANGEELYKSRVERLLAEYLIDTPLLEFLPLPRGVRSLVSGRRGLHDAGYTLSG